MRAGLPPACFLLQGCSWWGCGKEAAPSLPPFLRRRAARSSPQAARSVPVSYNLPSLSLAAPMLKWPGFEMPLPVVSKLMVSVSAPRCAGRWAPGATAGLCVGTLPPLGFLHPPCTLCGAAAPTRAPLVPVSLSRWREPPPNPAAAARLLASPGTAGVTLPLRGPRLLAQLLLLPALLPTP
ncbi:hypothetical protein Anapl_15670 [Anas platyrhynchos]|uniref:Uncharacterized protein n=1 Tax=Anas platyrhynchos TaxID=8839 RepID=R0LNI8_ANAPL|nr:hypothetical protein Anapl_15670 [Anas platyrhynchos]